MNTEAKYVVWVKLPWQACIAPASEPVTKEAAKGIIKHWESTVAGATAEARPVGKTSATGNGGNG